MEKENNGEAVVIDAKPDRLAIAALAIGVCKSRNAPRTAVNLVAALAQLGFLSPEGGRIALVAELLESDAAEIESKARVMPAIGEVMMGFARVLRNRAQLLKGGKDGE